MLWLGNWDVPDTISRHTAVRLPDLQFRDGARYSCWRSAEVRGISANLSPHCGANDLVPSTVASQMLMHRLNPRFPSCVKATKSSRGGHDAREKYERNTSLSGHLKGLDSWPTPGGISTVSRTYIGVCGLPCYAYLHRDCTLISFSFAVNVLTQLFTIGSWNFG